MDILGQPGRAGPGRRGRGGLEFICFLRFANGLERCTWTPQMSLVCKCVRPSYLRCAFNVRASICQGMTRFGVTFNATGNVLLSSTFAKALCAKMVSKWSMWVDCKETGAQRLPSGPRGWAACTDRCSATGASHKQRKLQARGSPEKDATPNRQGSTLAKSFAAPCAQETNKN